MHFLPLCGLVGLAVLITASPTPHSPLARKASVKVSAVPVKRLVVFSQDGFQGPSHEIDAANRCVKLESPIYKNLHSYGVVDQVCYFMDTDRCNGKVLVTADAQGTEVWGRVDVGEVNGYTGRITSVYCGKQAPVGGILNATKRAVSAKGDVRACKGKNCSWVSALNSCQAFSDDVVQHIDSLLQAAGSTCEYWANKGCSRLILTSISGSQDYHPNLGPGIEDGLQISAVSCKASRHVETLEGGSTVHAGEEISSWDYSTRSLATIEARSATFTPCDDPFYVGTDHKIGPGFLYFCATINHDPTLTKPEDCVHYRSCMGLQALDKCVSLKQDRNIFPLLDTLWQHEGVVCSYYKSSCSDKWPTIIIDSRLGHRWPYDYKKLGIAITEVRCYYVPATARLDAGPETLVLNSTSSLDARSANKLVSATSIATTTPEIAAVAVDYPVMMLTCHDVNLGGRCVYYTGPGCAPNPFNVDAIESLLLPRGWRCALYPYWNCATDRGPPQYIEARDGDLTINDVTYEIWSVTCSPLPF